MFESMIGSIAILVSRLDLEDCNPHGPGEDTYMGGVWRVAIEVSGNEDRVVVQAFQSGFDCAVIDRIQGVWKS